MMINVLPVAGVPAIADFPDDVAVTNDAVVSQLNIHIRYRTFGLLLSY